MFRYLPEQASEIAPKIDWIHNLITDISVFFTVAIVGAAIYFCIRYRKKGDTDAETPQIHGNHALEYIWTIVPTIICIYIAYYGVVYYNEMRVVPKDALTIQVTGQKWKWDFEYENGKQTTGEFYVPVNKPIKLVMTSRDVLHSFFLPAMRQKKDVVPGMYSYVSFTPVKTGTYHSFCTEYCGDSHYDMYAKLHVVSQKEYELWLNDRSAEVAAARMTPALRGREIFKGKGACVQCHSIDGSRLIGPSLLKLYGTEREFTDGSKAVADENYIKASMLYPNEKIVAGFNPNMMPSQKGLLSDDEITSVIAYIKSLDGTQPAEEEVELEPEEDAADLADLTPVQRGEKIYQQKACIGCHSLDGSKLVGPSFKGVYGKQGKLADGTDYVVDDEYIKNSIWKPNSQIVEGYAPAMPPYEGQLTEDDIKDVIEYMKTLQ